MDALYLIVTIAGQRVAISAMPVESVVELDAIVPVPRVPGHVAGLATLRSRVLTIIDCVASLGLAPATRATRAAASRAVIVLVDGHHYGLLVEEVRDVVAITQAPRPANLALGGGWARVVRGIVMHAGEALPLLDPSALIEGPPALAA